MDVKTGKRRLEENELHVIDIELIISSIVLVLVTKFGYQTDTSIKYFS